MKLIISISMLILKIIYYLFKLLPARNKVVMITKRNIIQSMDFEELKKEIQIRDDKTKVVVLYHNNKNLFQVLIEMYHIATSKACIIDSYIIAISTLTHKKELIIIQIWHSQVAIKKFGHQILNRKEGSSKKIADLMKMHNNYTYITCSSKEMIPYFSKAFNVEESRFVSIGLPVIDYIIRENIDVKNNILKKYPIFKEKINILYAPTFRKRNNIDYSKIINAINLEKYNLIIKQHPLDKTVIKENNPNVIIVKGFTSEKTLQVVDYLITDYSGISVEASVINKPVLFYTSDYIKYKKNRGFNIDLNEEFSKISFDDIEKLLEVIELNTYDYETLEKFKKMCVPYSDGSCSKRIIDLLEMK